MKLKFDITKKEYDIVHSILEEHLPPGCRVWVFGSRAKQQTLCGSDLDLALEYDQAIEKKVLLKLSEAFNDALLPYPVDLIEIQTVSESFRKIIEDQRVPFHTQSIPQVIENIPKLRFPEFKGEWAIVNLGSRSEHISYGLTVRPEYVADGIPLVSAREIISGNVNLDKAPKISTSDFQNLSDKSKPKTGDLFLSKTGSIGFSAIFSELTEIAITQNIAVIRLKDSTQDTAHYLLQFLKTCRFLKQAMSKVNQSTIMDLQLGDIKKLLIPFPLFPEQQKIASFLTSVDDKIGQLQRKKAALEAYKKGMMQQLFSQQTRFKDDQGKSFPDWEEKKLGEVATFKKGKGVSKSDICEAGQTPCIRYGQLYTQYDEVIENVISKTNIPTSELTLSEGNEVIIPASGETALDIATASCVISSGVALGGDLNIITSTLNGVFLAYYLNAAKKIEIARLAQGISVIHLYSSQLQTLKIQIPLPAEQQKIADFLTAIDRKVDLVAQELTQAQTFKKGLLQQMFV